jgi:competence protein ComEC
VVIFIIIFAANLAYEYSKYQSLIADEVYITEARVINIYKNDAFNTYKLRTKNFVFFTKLTKSVELDKLELVKIGLITTKLSFFDFVSGFYSSSFLIDKLDSSSSIKQLAKAIESEHSLSAASELFKALFLGIPLPTHMRDLFATWGVSHLIAISGFHLGLISFIVFITLLLPYNFLHTRYFPYRNKEFDLLVLSALILLIYLILTGFLPSLFRAFVMFVFGIVIFRSNIKIFSFSSLFLVILTILAIFPRYALSLSLWFSIAGVFYIYLFIQYFSKLNKIVQFLLFNVWIFLSLNIIIHYFFPATSIVQLLSPALSIVFVVFYPLELLLHLIGFGFVLDPLLKYWLDLQPKSIPIYTPDALFYAYLLLSFASIKSKPSFILLNIAMVAFNFWVFFYTIADL